MDGMTKCMSVMFHSHDALNKMITHLITVQFFFVFFTVCGGAGSGAYFA